jgi:hypothetical protein
VFAVNAASTSFPRADSDYAAGCGYVDINLVSAGEDVFGAEDFHQHLSIYDGLVSTHGRGLTAHIVAWPERDVIAVEIDDQREHPEAVNVDLRMLRSATPYVRGKNFDLARTNTVEVHTAGHVARSQLEVREGGIALTQHFLEGNFHSASAVAIGAAGRAARTRVLNETTVQLSVAPGRGRFIILIASAATFDVQADVAALALAELKAAASTGFAAMAERTAGWWHDYWSRGMVDLHSADGQADFVGEHYQYFLYLMGASSSGRFPPRFGGMIWRTTGDLSRWGSQYWWANMNALYSNLMPANRSELMDPLFGLYSGMLESGAIAARQQWGSSGHWIPEIAFFDGLETLPDDIATELQDLMLVRKPYEQRSATFQAFAEVRNRHHARWNFQADGAWEDGHYIVPNKGAGIFGHCTHILGVGTRIAALAWQRYQFAMDETWLRDRAYPFIRGAAEFYRNHPNFRKEADGLYHIHHVNNGEGQWDSSDTVYEVTCLHTIFPLAIRASEILGVDADLRRLWREIQERLVPAPSRDYDGLSAGFVYDGRGAIEPLGDDRELKRRFLGFNRLGHFIDEPGIGGAQIFRNRLRLREGPGAIDCEHIGALAARVHAALLDSSAPTTAGEPVLRLFHEWPRDWDAAFTLRARGAFVVSAGQKGGRCGPVAIRSEAGATCRLINPWGEMEVRLERDGRGAETLRGHELSFPTRRGERISLRPAMGERE